MNLHAPDAMGQAAHKAAMLISRLDLRLLGAASPTMPRQDRGDCLVRFFAVWPRLAAAVAELEAVAPGCAQTGFNEANQAAQFIEANAS